jgi:hypothetical protein
MSLARTVPLARTDAHRAALEANEDISPMNWPSLLMATKYSFVPLPSNVVNSRALLAPWPHLAHQNLLPEERPIGGRYFLTLGTTDRGLDTLADTSITKMG